jgi:hypothetical protein
MMVRVAGVDHHFDCFECAIQALAPRCTNCGVPIVGHGVEVDSTTYCSAHCGRIRGERGLCDHTETKVDTTQWSI